MHVKKATVVDVLLIVSAPVLYIMGVFLAILLHGLLFAVLIVAVFTWLAVCIAAALIPLAIFPQSWWVWPIEIAWVLTVIHVFIKFPSIASDFVSDIK